MLDHIRERIASALARNPLVTLATSGPAGVLVSACPCAAIGLDVFMLVPRTSDHLLNLEYGGEVALAADQWQLRGQAHLLTTPTEDVPSRLRQHPNARWCAVVQVKPTRFEFVRADGAGVSETFDL